MQRIGSTRFWAIFEYLNLGDKPHTILKRYTRNHFRPSESRWFGFQTACRFLQRLHAWVMMFICNM